MKKIQDGKLISSTSLKKVFFFLSLSLQSTADKRRIQQLLILLFYTLKSQIT